MNDRKFLDPETADEIKDRWDGILEHTDDEYSELAKIELEHSEKLRVLREQYKNEPLPEEALLKLMLDTHKKSAQIHISAEKRAADAYGDDVQEIGKKLKTQIYDYANKIYADAVSMKEAGKIFQWTCLRLTDDGNIFLDRETILDDFKNRVVIRALLERYAQNKDAMAILEKAMSAGLKRTLKCSLKGNLGAIVNAHRIPKDGVPAEKKNSNPLLQGYVFFHDEITNKLFRGDISTNKTLKTSDFIKRVNITFDIPIDEPLNYSDLAVYSGIVTQVIHENPFFTANMLEAAIKGKKTETISKSRQEKIEKSLRKLSKVKVDILIDKWGREQKQFQGNILKIGFDKEYKVYGHNSKGFIVEETPLLYEAAEFIGQCRFVHSDIWDMQIMGEKGTIKRLSENSYVLRNILFRKIMQAGNSADNKALIEYETLYRAVGKNSMTQTEKKRIIQSAMDILSWFEGKGLCEYNLGYTKRGNDAFIIKAERNCINSVLQGWVS